MCSQYPKYQSLSIITISSRRDPTVSPLLSAVSRGKLQRPSVTVLFISELFLQQSDKRSRNQTKDVSTKAGKAVKRRVTDLPQIHRTSVIWLITASTLTEGGQESYFYSKLHSNFFLTIM